MALNTSRIVYIPALTTPPIVRTRHIVLTAWFHFLPTAYRFGLGLIAALTTITEVKVQKWAFTAIPLTVMFLTFAVTIAHVGFSSSISIPRLGPLTLLALSFPLLLVFLLLGFPVSVQHDRVKIGELRLYHPRDPLNNIHLRQRLDLTVGDGEVLRHALGLRVGVYH